jgi:cation:H+ antiporter
LRALLRPWGAALVSASPFILRSARPSPHGSDALPLASLVALPGLYLGAADYLGLPHHEFAPPTAALIYGIAIIGAAFVLSWAAETARVDISAGLALAVLALTTVLPEYAVDFVFSLQAGRIYTEAGECRPGPDGANSCALALANMTGVNRAN